MTADSTPNSEIFLGATLELPLLIGETLLMWDALSRCGGSLSLLLGFRSRSKSERYGISWLFGLITLATTLLGMALVGLYYKFTLAVIAIGLAALGSRLRVYPGFLLPAVASLRAYFSLWYVALAGAFLLILATCVSLKLDEDSLIYHLAFPWQCFQIHRMPLESVTFLFHLPLPVDLSYGIPILLGDPRVSLKLAL